MRSTAGVGVVLVCLSGALGCAGNHTGSAAAAARAAMVDSLAALSGPDVPRTEILWDTWGVPHIFAKDGTALFFGFGWAQMRSHADLLLKLYGDARGRAAEYWGRQHLESDRWVWTNGIPRRAQEWWEAQSPEARAVLEAFVQGINAYASQHPEAVTDSLEQVLPVQPSDVLAHIQRVAHYTFVANPEEVSGLARAWRSHGSNAWAIGPTKSASGHGMLLANPHLPWSDRFTFFETQLVAEDIRAYGAALVGFPLPAIAFNDSLGWTHTVNTYDGADVYSLPLVDDGYLMDGVVHAFETEERTLRVKEADGRVGAEPLVVRRSVHGPVIAKNGGSALALRVAGIDQPHLIEQTLAMLRARNLFEFESALSHLQIPMFTVLYADRHGHILHVFNGRVPVRSGGDWYYWSGIVPGEDSRTLWRNYHTYHELPRVMDPPSGWLQNANDPPWTTTLPFPLLPSGFPPYMAAPVHMEFRAIRSARMLEEDESITFDELLAYKHSTRVESADHILEDLVHAARLYGDEAARRAADVLELWDRETNADSRGAILFQAFMREVARRQWSRGSPYDADWTPIAAIATPDGLSDPRAAADALSAAAYTVQQMYGALDRAWGEVHRLQRGNVDLPANGGPGGLGIFRVTDFERLEDGRFRADSGDSFVAAIEFGTPVRARALLSYGNASQPGSPHRTDQLPLYARRQLREVWLRREVILWNLEHRETF